MSMVDWPRVVKAITDAGWTQARIAREIRCSHAVVAAAASGQVRNVKFSVGAGLVKLHERVTLGAPCDYIDPEIYLDLESMRG